MDQRTQRGEQEYGNPVVFVHIPKTAGTSFRAALEQRFPPARTCPAYSLDELASMELAALAHGLFIRGHFFLGALKRLLPDDSTYITVLRDPVERALSTYAHVQAFPETVEEEWGGAMDLEEFVFHPLVAGTGIMNLQTRMLGATLEAGSSEEVREAVTREAREAFSGKCASAAAAIAALDQLAYFGLAERFEESLALLAYTFGWSPLDHVPRLNVSPRRPARERLPQHLHERLVALNQEDLSLYRYAEQVFDARVARMTVDLGMRA